MSEQAGQQPIIIIKRKRGGHHDGHHGGVWKIAYADFVTAMMAFFLVMWLINASNEETKAAVASYFNPVKLMDTTSNPKGVQNSEYGASSKDKPADEETPRARSDEKPADAEAGDADAAAKMDETIFRDPYAVLAEIAGGAGSADGGEAPGDALGLAEAGEPRPGMKGGIAYRDPFEPEFWAEQRVVAPFAQPKAQPMPETVATAPETPTMTGAEAPDPAKADETDKADEPAIADAPAKAEAPGAVPEADVSAPDEAAELQQKLADAVTDGGPALAVTQGEGGLVIDMTDGADFSMFELGSARPKRDVLALMEKIAAAIADMEGVIEISGHTDARPFKSGSYDNWRLSSARAQMAYYMLVRAGVPEQRIRSVSGHADREPRNPADPFAPENRRIEIRLVKADRDGRP